MTQYILTVTDPNGGVVNRLTKSSTESCGARDDADLQRRLAAVEADPRNLQVTVRPAEDPRTL